MPINEENLFAIKVNNVTKSFKGYADRAVTLKEKLIFKKRRKHYERQILKSICLTIDKGEVVGLIGENGCGKSTLLKLMTGILYPDNGEILTNGRVSSLLELGAGFHPDMSGRDNVYTNASIFGLTKKETDSRFKEILDFSELHEYIDNPVRTYSSGMYMRLAFSVAINVNADILLIDEILAVGDSNFQAKCFDKLKLLKSMGITIVIVTHDISVIESFCNRAVWLSKGRIAKDGDKYVVADAYKKYMNDKRITSQTTNKDFNKNDVYYAYNYFLGRAPAKDAEAVACCNVYSNLEELVNFMLSSEEHARKRASLGLENKHRDTLKIEFEEYRHKMHENNMKKDLESKENELKKAIVLEEVEAIKDAEIELTNKNIRFGNKKVEITYMRFETEENKDADTLMEGEGVKIRIGYKHNDTADRYIFGVDFYTMEDVHCFNANMRYDRYVLDELDEQGVITCDIAELNLVAGEYKVGLFVEDEAHMSIDFIREYKTFYVVTQKTTVGICTLKHNWSKSTQGSEEI